HVVLDPLQRIRSGRMQESEVDPVEQRQGNGVANGAKQVALSLEVPINRAARHARFTGDHLEAAAREAVALEAAQGGGEDPPSGLLRLLLGSSHRTSLG